MNNFTQTQLTVSYRTRFEPNEGTVYRQAVRMDAATFDKLKDFVLCEMAMDNPRKKEYVSTFGGETFLKPLRNEKGICYLNNTQTRFVNLFLKLKLKEGRNTCILIR